MHSLGRGDGLRSGAPDAFARASRTVLKGQCEVGSAVSSTPGWFRLAPSVRRRVEAPGPGFTECEFDRKSGRVDKVKKLLAETYWQVFSDSVRMRPVAREQP